MYEEDKLDVPIESPQIRIIKELEDENAKLKSENNAMKNDHFVSIVDHPYLDLSVHAQRLDKNIRRADKRLRKKELSTEDFIRLSNAMTYQISKLTPLADLILGISRIVQRLEKKK